jgi:hypothetical protein
VFRLTTHTLLLCAAVVLGGCATQKYDLKPAFSATNSDEYFNSSNQMDDQTACMSNNIKVGDERKKTYVHGKNFSSEIALKWLEDGVSQLKVSTDEKSNTIPIQVNLHKAYINHLATSKSATVVISAKQTNIQKFYRGRMTNINWSSSYSEFHESMNEALEQALIKFMEDGDFSISCGTT